MGFFSNVSSKNALPAVGPGAATYGGTGGNFVQSVTLDANGRVTAVAVAAPGGGGFTSTRIPYANVSGNLVDSTLFYSSDGLAINIGSLSGYHLVVRPSVSSASAKALVFSGTGSTASAQMIVGQNAGAYGTFTAYGNGDAGNIGGVAKANLIALANDPVTSVASALMVASTTAIPVYLVTNNVVRMKADSLGNVIFGQGSMATTATDGYLIIPSCAGAPTGVPSAFSSGNNVALQWDRTNHKLYAYDGAWVSVALT